MTDPTIRPTYTPPLPPPEPPPPPPVIETPEDAIAQANHDQAGTVFGPSHADTQANLASSREAAIDRAVQEGRSGDVQGINDAYDRALARLDAGNVAHEAKPEQPVQAGEYRTVDGVTRQTSTYADGTRITQTEGRTANGDAVVTTQVFPPGVTGGAAQVPLESRTVVANGVSTTSGLPTRTVEQAPDGSGTLVTDSYGGQGEDARRVVQHLVIANGQGGGYQVQSVTSRDNGADLGTPQPLRIREVAANGEVLLDTGEVSRTTSVAVPGQPGVSTITHQYDSGYRMEYRVHAAPAGTDGVPDALLSQKLVADDGSVAFQRDGVTRTDTPTADGGRLVVDTAADGSRTTYTTGGDGQLVTTQAYDARGALQQTIAREQVEGLPVVASRSTVTNADGTQVITEYDASGQPVGIRQLAADGSTVEQLGSLDGERIDAGSADDIASEILDVGKRTMWKDDYEARLSFALERLQTMDPVSQQQVLEALQQQDEGMGDSWFKTDILENLGADQLRGLEDGGLDILTGVQGTTAIDIERSREIHDLDVDAGQYTGEYGELAATGEEQHAGQLQAFTAEYQARAGDPASQQRFLAVYQRMHGDDAIEGFLSDETLASALDGGVSLYQGAGTVTIDRTLHDAFMGDRLETAADGRADVLAARDRVMDTGVRDFWTDDYEARVSALATEMQGLDPAGQAALVRQIVKEDPNARLSWLRDGSINEATQGNEAFTPEMRALVTGIRGNGETTFGGQLLGFGSGVKNAAWGFVVGLGALARTAYDLSPSGIVTDLVTGGNGPAWLPSAQRGAETGQAMIEGLPNMFAHIGEAWTQGRYGEALGNVTFDVASLLIPVKIPKIRLPGGAGAADNLAGAADNLAGGARYIDDAGRPVAAPSVEPRLATPDANGVYTITDAAPPRLGIEGAPRRLELEPAATPEVIAQRRSTATEFYGRGGRAVDDSHLQGIDFTRPVDVQPLRAGDIVYQWQTPGAPLGNYFSHSAAVRPTDLGIAGVGTTSDAFARIRGIRDGIDANAPAQVRNPDGTYRGMDPQFSYEVGPAGVTDKVLVAYRVTEDMDVLVSTSKPINDTWSIRDGTLFSMPTEGGRLQLYAQQTTRRVGADEVPLFEPLPAGGGLPPTTPPSLAAASAYHVPPNRSVADDVAGTQVHPWDRDFLAVAQHVYRADGSPLAGGFRQMADSELPPGITAADLRAHPSGLQAGLYTNADGAVVLAFKGTDVANNVGARWRDIRTDIVQGTGFPTAQYAHAVELTRRAYSAYGENLVLTGHSLGGGLAAQATLAVGTGNIPAVVFNNAAVHPRNLARENPLFADNGGVQHAPDGGSFANDPSLAPYFAEQGGLVRSYVVENEVLTRVQDALPFMPSAIGHREILPPHGTGPFASFGAHGTDAVTRSFDQRFPDGPRPLHGPDAGVWYLDPETGRFSLAPPEGG